MSQAVIIEIADWNQDVRDMSGQLLDSVQYTLAFASIAEEALVIAVQLVPDPIWLDVMMPGMSDYEVCRRLFTDKALAE
jgi:CheY-like chemotaxis protein